MSKLICSSAINGAIEWVRKAESMVVDAIGQKGPECPVAFPDTAFYLPVIYSFTGKKMQTLADLREIINDAKALLPAKVAEKNWLPYLGQTLDAGVATLFACEVIEACKYVIGPNPVDGIWLGAASDVVMRERGIEFVDGSAPGFAAIVGAAPDSKTAVKLARELQEKNIYVFMAGATDGVSFAQQLADEGIQLGWETRLVPFGKDVSAAIYALGFANRTALSFGGVKPGDFESNLKYNKNRVFAFVLALGEVDEQKYAAAAAAINYGFPCIADTDIPEILPTGICTYEHVVSNVPYETIVEKALEVRGCKIKITKVPIPVSYGSAFEGERIRLEDTHVEFGGNKSPAFEYVTSVDFDAINDGEIVIIGPDIDEIEPETVLPLGIWVEVAGRKMQSDFEPILERQIHHLINSAEGIWHMGQRDIVWTRVSKDGFRKGLRMKDYGEIIHAKFLGEYPAIVDKVKVTICTELEEVERRQKIARETYEFRNRRVEAMTDETVDTFYSCLLCQAFAPNHVCIITPERLGLCGAYNWLDGKAAFEIDETGGNHPVKKGECLDPVKGIWTGVNEYVYQNSHKAIAEFCAYSIMDRPMTSCGCFEAICAYVPECNGVMVVNREFLGDTPVGMTFSALASNVGGGIQTPGFMGVGKVFLTSRKFLYTEGGFGRLVWMPKEIKEYLRPDLEKRFEEQGLGKDFFCKIADETVATAAEEVRAFMEKVEHPALKMSDMADYVQSEDDEPALADRSAGNARSADRAGFGDEQGLTEKSGFDGEQGLTGKSGFDDNQGRTGKLEPDEKKNARDRFGRGEKTEGHSDSTDITDTASALDIAELKKQIMAEVRNDIIKEVVGSIISTLSVKFLGAESDLQALQMSGTVTSSQTGNASSTSQITSQADGAAHTAQAGNALATSQAGSALATSQAGSALDTSQTGNALATSQAGGAATAATFSAVQAKQASILIDEIKTFDVKYNKCESPIWEVKLGNVKGEGGSRGKTLKIGGQTCLPFHMWEGKMPNRPLVALEVLDVVNEKYPQYLVDIYGKALVSDPVEWAKSCVNQYGADVLSVSLGGTHPEKGNRSAADSVKLVGDILKAVDVPLIITGHTHYEKTNEVMKAVAQSFPGENLLLNWVEQDNYKTIAGAAMAYGHSLVAQSPIDVNIAKQMCILLTNMDFPKQNIIIDPTTSALGYGLEYTYSVMERIRVSALDGEIMLSAPMLVTPGRETVSIKEAKALEADFPAWGDLTKRSAALEFVAAQSYLYAGADLLIMYHPEAAMEIKKTIDALLDGKRG